MFIADRLRELRESKELCADCSRDANARLFSTRSASSSCGPFLRPVHGTVLVAADVEKRSRLWPVDDHGGFALRAFRFLGDSPILSFIKDIRLRFLNLPKVRARCAAVRLAVAEVPVVHQVKVIEFTKWLERTGGSPRDVVQRQSIRTILGMPSFRQN